MKNRFLLILAAALFAATPLLAQTETTTGSINGVISDNTGGLLPGVTVTATNTQTGLSRNAVTENEGTYTILQLPPGTYRVNAELAGLGTAQKTGVTVLLGSSTKVDVKLQPQVAETITVTAESPVVDVTDASAGEAVTQQEIENLPILGRDFKDLILLTPGVTTAFGGRVSLVGARGTAVDFNIDGANANSDFFAEERGGTAAPYVFSQAAIREFRVIRNTYSAEYSRGGGGTMNAITKSGTNSIEGEAFYYLRDKEWADARTLSGGVEESYDAKDAAQYGFAAGGPILRDRLFWFLNADIQKIKERFNVADFRTSARFAGLDPTLRNSVVARLEQLTGGSLDDQFAYDTRENQDTLLAKLDWNIGSTNHLNFRWNNSDFNNFPSESSGTLSNQGEEFNTVNSYVGQLDSVLSTSLYNFALGQYSLEERPINALTTSFPQLSIGGLLQSGNAFFGQRDFLPNGTDEEKWEVKDTLTWIRGNHQIKTGFNYLTVDVANLFVRDLAGDFIFNTPQEFLAGTPSRFEQGFGVSAVTAFDFQQYGGFLMDTWRPIPQLTLDLGVRYDLSTIPKPFRNIYEATNPELDDNFVEDDDNFAPRFGFAYDLSGNGDSVLRGGVGMYYTAIPAILLAQPVQQIGGLFNNFTFNCAQVTCPTFPSLFTETQLAGFDPTAVLDITTMSSDFEAGESIRGSLGYQQRLFTDYSFEVEGILGQHTKQQRLVNVNAVPTGLTFGDIIQYTTAVSNKPYPNFRDVRSHVSDAEGDYKSATLSLRKLGLGGGRLSWLAHYTWSEAIDQDTNSRSTSTSFSYDPYNAALSEGPSDNDVTHRVVASATYQLPLGFFVSGIFNWRTGQPYTRNIFFTGGAGNLTGLTRMPNVPVFVDDNGDVIDLTQAMGGATNITPQQLSTFISDRNGRIVGRNTENQPDFMNLDMRVSKRFNLPAGMDVELIGEVFNVFNQSNRFITTNNQNEFTIRQTGTATAPLYAITKNTNYAVENGLDFNSPPRQYQAAVKFHF